MELTSFVGRRRELGEVRRLLGAGRLVTLTGVGGTGKTRLARRAAGELRRAFPGGTWFVDLSALRASELLVVEIQNPEMLAYMVMGALGLRDQAGAGSPVEQLVRYLAERQALLVLDNCEHLLPVSAVLADTLLRGCPQLTILATSREPLLLDGETVFAVPPLPLPAPRASLVGVERFESVALFAARAQAVAPNFTLTGDNAAVVAELCRRLDGLPLAIELAAARIPVLAPAQILERLTERFGLLSRGSRAAPERQQTLRASVEWSFDLCTEPERLLWARSSVFVGGFELDAVEGICVDEQLAAAELFDVVAGLVDKSILVRDGAEDGATARYRMLETLSDYGRERLTGPGEQDRLRRRHRDWYADLARRFEAGLISPRQPDWFARVDRELPNIRAALQCSLADPDGAEAAQTMAAIVFLYWTNRGLQREGGSWMAEALARPTRPTMARVKALYAHTSTASTLGDLEAASTNARDARAVATDLGDPRAYAIAACTEGYAAMISGDLAEAVRRWQRGVDGLAGEQAEEYLPWRLIALLGHAMTKALLGDIEGVTASHEAILTICQPRSESWFAGLSSCYLGVGLWRHGELDAASVQVTESLRRLRRVDDTICTSLCLDMLAWIAVDQGRTGQAATLIGAAMKVAQVMGARAGLYRHLSVHREHYEQQARKALGEQAYRVAFARGAQMSLDEAVRYALDEPAQSTAPKQVAEPALLTQRERQVADLILQGLSNKEIAVQLVISQRTAESHVDHILTKLALTSRVQVAAWMAARPSSQGS